MSQSLAGTIFILIFLFLLSSCQKEADVKLPNTEPKLVVTSFVSPQDTAIKINVRLSAPIFGTFDRKTSVYKFAIVEDATVEISDGMNSVKGVYYGGGGNSTQTGNYYVDTDLLRIEEGSTLTLMVSTPSGLSVQAQCTIPAMTSLTTIELKDDSESEYPEMILTWKDNNPEENYYGIYGSYESPTVNRFGDSTVQVFAVSFDEVYSYRVIALAADNDREGGEFRRKGRVWSHSSPTEIKRAYGYLLTTDQHYYKYHNSIQVDNDNPFAEPVLPYSNIEGGLGVFAAYNKTVIEKEL